MKRISTPDTTLYDDLLAGLTALVRFGERWTTQETRPAGGNPLVSARLGSVLFFLPHVASCPLSSAQRKTLDEITKTAAALAGQHGVSVSGDPAEVLHRSGPR